MTIAEGPGTGCTEIPSATAAWTSRYPGSATSGMPASEISDPLDPASSLAINSGAQACFFVVVVIADERLPDVVMVQKYLGVPGILARDPVRFAQNADRPERDVFQISDGRSHQVEDARHVLTRQLV